MIKKAYNNNKETIHNFIWRALQIFGKQGISFVIFLISAKLLTTYNFGVYNYVLATLFFLIMFCDFGISTATSKYTAEYNAVDKKKIKLILFNSTSIIIILTLIITLFILLFGKMYFKENYVYVLYLLPLLILAPVTSLYDGIYCGLRKFKKLAVISISTGIISLCFVYPLITKLGLSGALIAQILLYFILLIGLILGYREFKVKINKQVISDIGRYAFAFGLANAAYYMFSRIDILILGHYGYITQIATYSLLNRFFGIFLIPFSIFGTIIAPIITANYARKKYLIVFEKYKSYIKNSLLTSVLCGIISSLIIIFGVRLFLHNYYSPLFFTILILSIFIFIFSAFNAPINAGVIVATGYAKLMTYLNLFLGVLNLGLSLLLLHFFGYLGVIYATLIANIIGTIFLQFWFYKKLKIILKNDK